MLTYDSERLNAPISSFLDLTINAIRLRECPRQMMPLDVSSHNFFTEVARYADDNGVAIPPETPHIPRPPNSFILYRQHHHHAITAANPATPNTEICESYLVYLVITVLT